MINLFMYTNYRLYLKDKYNELKKENSSFSYRYFSMKCGYSSPNFLKLVMDGKRNLSEESIEKFALFFKFDQSEKRYFSRLVKFNQAKTSDEKKDLAQEILKSSVFNRIHPLAKDQFEYASHWYYVAVREILGTKRIKLDAKSISRIIKPRLSEKKIEKILETLLRLGMIKKKDNRYIQVEELISTGDEVTFAGVAGYHRQMMTLASESIDSVERQFRDISGVTIGLSPEGVEELKTMVQKFRKNIMELSERDRNKQNVYQVNMQMFPLTEMES